MKSAGIEPPVQVISARRGPAIWLGEFLAYRSVLFVLCGRDLRAKYKQAALGVAWAVLQPAVQVGVFTLVFRGVAGVPTDAPYPAWVLAGLLPFNLFQQVVTTGTPAFAQARPVVTKVYFPRLYTVIAGSFSAFVNVLVSGVLLLATLAWYGIEPRAGWLWAVPLLALVYLLALGLAAFLAAINARFRDVQHALPMLTNALLFVTPVLYPDRAVPSAARILVDANPLFGLVESFRSAVLGTPGVGVGFAVASMAAAVVVMILGAWWFERHQAALVDIL